MARYIVHIKDYANSKNEVISKLRKVNDEIEKIHDAIYWMRNQVETIDFIKDKDTGTYKACYGIEEKIMEKCFETISGSINSIREGYRELIEMGLSKK